MGLDSGTPADISGYTLVLPPGWDHIPVRRGTKEAIKNILDRKFRSYPENASRDAIFRHRVEMEGKLRKAATEARKKGGTELYLPVDTQHGVTIPASFVVSEGSVSAPDGADPAEVVALLAAETDSSKPVTVDGAFGLRIERVTAPDPAQDTELPSRCVDYILSVPGDPGRWLLAAFSTFGAGDTGDGFAGLLVELFDAIISTFRWKSSSRRHPEGGPGERRAESG
jgi:hypothetical protein